MTLTSGQWKAPTRFLPSGRLTAVFPPIAASTWPTSVVGTATHRIPRRKAAAANPAASVVQPPPNATMIPSRSSRSSRQIRSTAPKLFASSPARSAWTGASSGGPCSPSTVASASTSTSPAGTSSASRATLPSSTTIPPAASTTASASEAVTSAHSS